MDQLTPRNGSNQIPISFDWIPSQTRVALKHIFETKDDPRFEELTNKRQQCPKDPDSDSLETNPWDFLLYPYQINVAKEPTLFSLHSERQFVKILETLG